MHRKKMEKIVRRKKMHRFGKKVICVCLAVGLTLSCFGCSKKTEETAESQSSVESAARVSNGELKGDSVAVAVGKEGVSYDEYRVYSWFLKNQYDAMLTGRPNRWAGSN